MRLVDSFCQFLRKLLIKQICRMLDAQMRTVKTKIEDLADRIRRLQAAGHPDNAPNVRSGLTNLMQLQEEYHRLGQEWALASR